MKISLSLTFVVVISSFTSAQSQCDSIALAIPSCAQSCLLSAGSQIGCTAATDYACQCSSAAALQSAAQNCVVSACGVASALAVVTSASAVCGCIATATPPQAPPVAAPVTTSSTSVDAIPTPPATSTLTLSVPAASTGPKNPVNHIPPRPTRKPSQGFGLLPPRPTGTRTRKPFIIGTGGIPACKGTGFLTLPSIAIPSQLLPLLPTGLLPPIPGVPTPTPQAPTGGPAAAPTPPAAVCNFKCRELKGLGFINCAMKKVWSKEL